MTKCYTILRPFMHICWKFGSFSFTIPLGKRRAIFIKGITISLRSSASWSIYIPPISRYLLGIRLYHLLVEVVIIVVERSSSLEASLRLIVQSSMILLYRSRYSSPLIYSYINLVIEALRSSPQFRRF